MDTAFLDIFTHIIPHSGFRVIEAITCTCKRLEASVVVFRDQYANAPAGRHGLTEVNSDITLYKYGKCVYSCWITCNCIMLLVPIDERTKFDVLIRYDEITTRLSFMFTKRVYTPVITCKYGVVSNVPAASVYLEKFKVATALIASAKVSNFKGYAPIAHKISLVFN